MKKRFIVFAGFSGAIAVALGAMGAHYLKKMLQAGSITEKDLHAFETGAQYQMYHALALIAVAAMFDTLRNDLLIKAGRCFMLGTVLFSGSLYLIATSALWNFTNIKLLGPITPIGGLFFIAGWVLLGLAGLKKEKQD
jgi:uncharacterized membrane protein YgdD (TMEM256/DUF423 family)